MSQSIRIGTRGSQLALRQTNWVAGKLAELNPGLSPEIVTIKTTGDQVQDEPLSKIGVTGIFTKELDRALLDGRIDLAVHSLKDIPTLPVDGIMLAAFPEREISSDAFIGKTGPRIEDLPAGSHVGTGSLRRRAQLLALRPDLAVADLRGNIDTRLRILRNSDTLDGIILAAAGVRRVGLFQVVTEVLDPQVWLSAPGQGALALATRSDNAVAGGIARVLEHPPTRIAVTAERALLARLGGGCHVPIGAYARVEDNALILDAFIADPSGINMVRRQRRGAPEDAENIGALLGETLLSEGGAEILDALNTETADEND